jgi:hypothetical protein
LNDAGETIEDLEFADNQSRTEEAVKAWLRGQIKRIQQERTSAEGAEYESQGQAPNNVRRVVPGKITR